MSAPDENDRKVASAPLPLALTCQIVGAYLRHNTLPASEIPSLLKAVYAALHTCAAPRAKRDTARPAPAVPIRKSVRAEFIVCLEDGRKLKMLKRYLRARYNMSPDEYRQRWGLAADYPMVAPRYASERSRLAKQHGLGRRSVPSAAKPRASRAP